VNATAWIEELRSGPGWMRLLEQRGAQLLCIALLIALGVDCAMILTRALSHFAAASPSALPAASAPARPVAVNPAIQLATIVNAHLFGTAAGSGADNAPNTTMPLILAGVIADKDPNKGQAIIGASAASGKLYAVGAMIPGGARLHAIFTDRVLIERNGALETLPLPRNAPSGAARSVATPPSARAEAAVAQNSTVLAGLVHIQPVFNQGKLSGYRIFPGGTRGNSAFTQLGLRAGDMVVGVNGTALDDAGRAMEILQTLSSSASASVTVSRNGQTQEVNLNLANLNIDAESNPSDNSPGNAPAAAAGAAASGDATPGATPQGQRGRVGAMPLPAPPAASPSTANGSATGADAGAAQTEGAVGANGANGDRER
jgi:general secretion pathway protein C